MLFGPAIALLHSVPRAPRTPGAALTASILGLADVSYRSVLYDFSQPDQLEEWERIDDVIMGGVSSSRLVVDGSSALFEGRLRSDGGGFCGQRMRLLAEPLDLSAADGVFVDCEALSVGAEPSKRVWKMAIRTKQDRGEVVYQAAFKPPTGGRATVNLPFDAFRLVRGPRLVPGVPPLSAAQTNETYQISLVVSKFEVSETGAALPGFEEGLFAMRLHELGTFSTRPPPFSRSMPRALSEREQAKAAPPLLRLLRPLLGLVFGEPTRRRRAATRLLEARGSSRLQRARLGWAWRAASGGPLVAARKTAALGLKDAGGFALSLPVRLLFKLIVWSSKMVKTIIRALTLLAEERKEGGPAANAASA